MGINILDTKFLIKKNSDRQLSTIVNTQGSSWKIINNNEI